MKAYLDILQQVYENGHGKPDRTGVGTVSAFASRFRHDLRDGFPLLTTKYVNPLSPLVEMFAFFRGATNLDEFHALKCKIWDRWALKQNFGNWVLKNHDELSADVVEYEASQGNAITLSEASIMIDNCKNAHHNYHTDLRRITENNALTDFATAQQNITKWMAENPEPTSLIAWLTERDINTYKYNVIYAKGYLGPIYGAQWLGWKTPDGRTINQLEQVVNELRTNPSSRRIVLLGWNPSDISDGKKHMDENNKVIHTSDDRIQANIMEGKMALPPCHLMTIFNVDLSGAIPVLNLHQIMRSSDLPIGLPFNIAGYAYFLSIVAHQLGYIAGELVIDSTDAHIYKDQLEFVPTQLAREPKRLPKLSLPIDLEIDITKPETLTLDLAKSIVDCFDDYDPHPHIPYPVAV